MRGEHNIISQLQWSGSITNLEAEQEVAQKVAQEVKDGDIIGFGSGSTSFLAIQAIAARLKQQRISCTAIPTFTEVAFARMGLGIPTV